MSKAIFLILVLALLPILSEAGSLKESLDAIRANAASITSGSISYKIESFRPKENLLGAPSRNIDGNYNLPHTGEKDATLPGKGWIKWNKDSVIAETVRRTLFPKPDGSLATQIVVERECSTPGGAKVLRITFQSGNESPSSPLANGNYGQVIEQLGSEQGPAKFRGSLTFRQMEYVIVPLLSKTLLFRSDEKQLSYSEKGKLRLINRPAIKGLTLDATQGFLPVQEEVLMGLQTSDSKTKYLKTGECWLPETNRTEYWEGAGLRYAVTCTTLSHETGRNYPPEDFTITFPPGTEMDDRYDSEQ